jgi:hypothetical protein
MNITDYTVRQSGILWFLEALLVIISLDIYSQALPIDQWQYIQIDSTRQKWGDFQSPEWLRYFGLDFGDVNKDGYLDIISGRYFYLNPGGNMELPWNRFDLGVNVDGYLVTDIDGDAFLDIITEAFPKVYWFESQNQNGSLWNSIEIGELPATDHVNAQGGGIARLLKGKEPQVVLSTGDGIYAAIIPNQPDIFANWKFSRIVPNNSDEGMSFADFDGDGDTDIATGDKDKGADEALVVNWYENPGTLNNLWQVHPVGRTVHWADRFKAADLNGDKWPDIIVSEERYPGPDPDANLFWYENPGIEANRIWIPHPLLTAYSLNNLDAADLDRDGDIDLVTNEHKGQKHKLFILENDGKGLFHIHIADTGKECHLGARFADLDSDGDLDIVGHAWDNFRYLHIWRNDAINRSQERIHFKRKELSQSATLHPVICDMNKDGFNDLACVTDYVDANGDDGNNIKSVGFFMGPDFLFKTVARMNFRSCDMHVTDVNGDGYPDIIGRDDSDANDTNETGMVFWLRNPGLETNGEWVKFDLGHASYTKDINHADFNHDGKTDLVMRTCDGKLFIYFQQSAVNWITRILLVPHHDGMAIGDINGDNNPDIVLNGFWMQTPEDPLHGDWIKHDFDPRWYMQKTGDKGGWWDNNTKVTVHDMNSDNQMDILISQAESAGWPVCWYENSSSKDSVNWKIHIIGYVDYCHTLQVADLNNDGLPDIFCGELIPWDDKRIKPYHPVILFINKDKSLSWDRQVINTNGCYGGKTGDLDNDGDIDLIAPRNYERGPLNFWMNMTINKE